MMAEGKHVFFENETGNVVWWPKHRVVYLEFTGFLAGDAYRELLLKGIELLEKRGSDRWMGDMLKASVMGESDTEWVNEVWIPKALDAGVKRIATLLPTNIIAHMQLNRIRRGLESNEDEAPQARMAAMTLFTSDIAEGLSWLVHGIWPESSD